jgi:hypothetical protein
MEPIFKRLDYCQRILLTCVCSITLGLFVIHCILKFESRGTATADSYIPLEKVPFPEVSFCPNDRYKMDSTGIGIYRVNIQISNAMSQ